MYPVDGQMHVGVPHPPSETAAAASVSRSPSAVYSSPSTHAASLVQQHPTTVSSGSVLSPDHVPSQSPLMAASQDMQQGAVSVIITGSWQFLCCTFQIFDLNY